MDPIKFQQLITSKLPNIKMIVLVVSLLDFFVLKSKHFDHLLDPCPVENVTSTVTSNRALIGPAALNAENRIPVHPARNLPIQNSVLPAENLVIGRRAVFAS